MSGKKVIYLIALLFLVLGGLIFNSNKVFSYSSTPTHPNLAKEMIRLYNMYYDPDITDEKVKQIIQGSIDEDMAPRWSFHLYDPIYDRAPFGVATAKEWGVADIQGDAVHKFANALLNIFGTNKFSYHGDFSWTANIKNYANNNSEKAYYGLGHTLHLIADMTVPAHSRNDHHVLGDPFESWSGGLKSEDYVFADKLFEQPKLPLEIYRIEQAFDELARYSNKYFFSKDSIKGSFLGDQYVDPKIIDEREYDFGKYVSRLYVMGRGEDGDFIRLARVVGTRSSWTNSLPEITNNEIRVIGAEDYNIQRDYWSRLAPKAVEYGMATIKLFLDDAEYEKAKIAKEDKKSLFAKVFNLDNNQNTENNNYTPPPQLTVPPSRLPESQDAVILPTEENIAETNPAKRDEIDINSETPLPEINPEASPPNSPSPLNSPNVVIGQKTGNEGGMAPGAIAQINNPPVDNQGDNDNNNDNNNNSNNNDDNDNNNDDNNNPPTSHLVINEIQVRDNEFVELYNPTSSSIDLSEDYFSYFSSTRDFNDPHRNKQFPEGAAIPASGYYLIGLEGYPASSGNPDADWQVYDSDQLSNSNGSIGIFPFDPTTKTSQEAKDGTIDIVAWGSVDIVKEIAEFNQTLGVDKSMQRKLGADTNNNNNDFEFKEIPSPTNSLGKTHKGGTVIGDHTVISADTAWTAYNSPYYLESNAGQWPIVESGATLTIEPGTVIMARNPYYTFLEVRGTLKAEGTADNKIVFTSEKDADYGGIGGAAKGDMKNLVFTSTSKDSVLDYALFRYGAETDTYRPNAETIRIEDSSVLIKNSTIELSAKNGIYLKNSNSTIENTIIKDGWVGIYVDGNDASKIQNNQFKDNFYHGIEATKDAKSEIKNNAFTGSANYAIYTKSAGINFSGNSATNNGINGIGISDLAVLSEDTTWNSDMAYVIDANAGSYFTINKDTTLILKPGVVIKAGNQYCDLMVVNGTLQVEGVPGNEIIFTSLKDDNFGGDTNNDGNSTIPQAGDWKQIEFKSTSTGSVFDYVKMYYGTGNPPITKEGDANVEIKDTVEIKNP